MKIFIGIKLIVLVVFLDFVELLSPKRLPGQVHVPDSLPSTSCPSPPKRINNEVTVTTTEEEVPRFTYIEDPIRGFISADRSRNVFIFEFEHIIIGRVMDDQILPIFNKRHEIIRIDYNQNGLRIPMNRTEAECWGVFGKYSQFIKTPPPVFG